jgi:hypothetical protein
VPYGDLGFSGSDNSFSDRRKFCAKSSLGNSNTFLSGTRPVPTGAPVLECLGQPPIRTRLRGLSKLDHSFCGERWRFPPSADRTAEFRARARPQPSVTPTCPTSHEDFGGIGTPPGRLDNGGL